MIEPFLQYWGPQLFWLTLCWMALYVMLRWFCVPVFFEVRKKRHKTLKKLQSDTEKVKARIADLQCIMEQKNFAIAKKTFSVLEEARTQSLKEVQEITDQLSAELHQRGKEKEEEYQRMCIIEKEQLDKYPWSDLAKRFMSAMEDDNV